MFSCSLINSCDLELILSWLAINVPRSSIGNSSGRKWESGWHPMVDIKVLRAVQGSSVCTRLWLTPESSPGMVQTSPPQSRIWVQWLGKRYTLECSHCRCQSNKTQPNQEMWSHFSLTTALSEGTWLSKGFTEKDTSDSILRSGYY